MTTKFMYSGNFVNVASINEDTALDHLKPKIYDVCYNAMQGQYYLECLKARFDLPSKIYGSHTSRADHIIKSYKKRDSSTGVLFSGDKGSGKTLLAQIVCNRLLSEGIPVILINSPFSGQAFNTFMESIGECIVFFDEFGKVYSTDDGDKPVVAGSSGNGQTDLLTFFDGTTSSKRLIFVTENSVRDINEYMINRPGRLLYHFHYQKLEESVIKEYCNAMGVSQQFLDELLAYTRRTREISFDIMKAIVEEHLEYGSDIKSVQEMLNIPDIQHSVEMFDILDVTFKEGGGDRKLLTKSVTTDVREGSKHVKIHYEKKEGDDTWNDYYFINLSKTHNIQYEDDEKLLYSDSSIDVTFKKRGFLDFNLLI